MKMPNLGKDLFLYDYVRCLRLLRKIHVHPAGDSYGKYLAPHYALCSTLH